MPTERLPVDPPLSTVDHIPSSQTTPTASGVHFLVYDPSTVDLVSLTTTDPVSSLKSEAPVQHGTGDHNIDLPPREVADTLIKLFFDKVHCDFPILHRTLFQVHYEKTRASTKYRHDHQYTPKPDPAWLVCLFMVFVLGLEDIDGGDSAMEALGGLLGCGISGSGSPGTSGNSRSRSSGGSGGSGGNGSTAANSPRHTSPVRPQIATRLQLVRGLLSPPLWVDVNHYDHRGQTVLIAFVTYIPDDQEDKAKSLAALFGLLLAAGARLEGRNRRGETALLVAARLGRTIALTSLLGHGANVHVRDMKGRGVLDVIDKQCRHAAHKDVALYGRLEACRVLLTGKKYLFLGAKQRPTLLDEWSAVPAGGWRGL